MVHAQCHHVTQRLKTASVPVPVYQEKFVVLQKGTVIRPLESRYVVLVMLARVGYLNLVQMGNLKVGQRPARLMLFRERQLAVSLPVEAIRPSQLLGRVQARTCVGAPASQAKLQSAFV